jgi:hypothetical protein
MHAFKILAAGVLTISLVQAASGQSLTEAAKKEKERRENLKGKAGVVVTNADLAGTKRKPAITSEAPAEGAKPAAAAAEKRAEAGRGETAPAADPQDEARKKFDEKKSDLETRLDKARELVELLGLKMNALWQQFYSFNTMMSKAQVQQQISETHLRLQAAQAEEKKIKDELEKLLSQGGKENFLIVPIS